MLEGEVLTTGPPGKPFKLWFWRLWQEKPSALVSFLFLEADSAVDACAPGACVHTGSAAQLCPSLGYPVDCSPPGTSVHGVSQARMLERVAIAFSRRSSRPRAGTCISCFAGRLFPTEPPGKPHLELCCAGSILTEGMLGGGTSGRLASAGCLVPVFIGILSQLWPAQRYAKNSDKRSFFALLSLRTEPPIALFLTVWVTHGHCWAYFWARKSSSFVFQSERAVSQGTPGWPSPRTSSRGAGAGPRPVSADWLVPASWDATGYLCVFPGWGCRNKPVSMVNPGSCGLELFFPALLTKEHLHSCPAVSS